MKLKMDVYIKGLKKEVNRKINVNELKEIFKPKRYIMNVALEGFEKEIINCNKILLNGQNVLW